MDDNLNDGETLNARIQQVERERDELRKDIEQLCMQQAGPSYLAVATRMHFQRTAGLEQEIENLKKKLAACTRENFNLQEELSEAFRIKSQLADLHGAEVSKNIEAEKQVKFFQGCVAAAFAERDHSIMEAEKAKEKEELISNKFNDSQKSRVEELTFDLFEEKKLTATLEIDLEEQKRQNETFKEVIDKFYEIRQHSLKGFLEDTSWEDKCECLLHDSAEMWSVNDDGETSTSKYISAIEEEVKILRKSVANLQNKLRMGLEIEDHLKKRVRELEKKSLLSEEMINKRVSELLKYHSQYGIHIKKLLDEGYSNLKSTIDVIEEKIRQLDVAREQKLESPRKDVKLDESECRDVHVNTDTGSDLINQRNDPGLPNILAIGSSDVSEALAQALQEKVSTLLLLSQQEERHLLDRNVSAALQKKLEELQRNLLQVTNEKVKALMELAQMKQEYQLLQGKISHETKQGKLSTAIGEKSIVQGRDGRLKNLLKKTYLRRWVGTLDLNGGEAEAHLNSEGLATNRMSNYSIDFARMKVENATLKESLESMDHLTSSVRRLRLSLMKVKELITSEGTITSMSDTLDNIVTEANLVKTALGSSLPVSWSAEVGVRSFGESFGDESVDPSEDSGSEKVDFVSAAGFEMVETLILAAQVLKDHTTRGYRDES
ncbi:uncharacterized protein LOC132300087 isoform X1 [Cornus florida]|uniref:uncharacterized protein LOC132300087 isoform X1 n=1 Tax=Cornus florida TaxID=4283 RepID=UPI0028980A22|nr:uncharacterized protein LOC132300087 isoform X1 [Cornus florida]XP_059653004.1 uncharacterized protein LOC132300087 isoform X1 [Cornus florida]XP_059653005.1 uncharacterized protein LOC132300087 isoform X1 [Cornus florida]